jgi:L-amino acid N-acyltransferase YncA
MSQPGSGHLIRVAAQDDLDAIARFEVEIALVSFGAEAITDPALHRKRVAGALGKTGEVTLIAAARDAPGTPLGWAWMSARTNSLTGARYGNFRSLAVADGPDRSLIGELLLGAVLRAADEAGFTQLTGKVHSRNLGMRALYRKFGFEAAHITMERRLPAGPATGPAPPGVGAGPATGPAASGRGAEPATGPAASGRGAEPATGPAASGRGAEPGCGQAESGGPAELGELGSRPARHHGPP